MRHVTKRRGRYLDLVLEDDELVAGYVPGYGTIRSDERYFAGIDLDSDRLPALVVDLHWGYVHELRYLVRDGAVRATRSRSTAIWFDIDRERLLAAAAAHSAAWSTRSSKQFWAPDSPSGTTVPRTTTSSSPARRDKTSRR
jgi:hypothetical protein